jgi:dTDP-4-amino-4,6-dideoxygalactose transaminase
MKAEEPRFLIPKDQVFSPSFLTLDPGRDRFAGVGKAMNRYRFFWARNAIYYSLKALGVRPGDRILVPSYICSAAVEPILAYGADAVFYAIRRDCTPDLADIKAKIDAETRAIFAVHYFGFPQGIRECRDLCDRCGLFLIEDCAHVLRGDVDGLPSGAIGDASVFSWRKLLPLFDGGELILNRSHRELEVDWRSESLLFTLKVAKSQIDHLVAQTHHPAVRIPYRWIHSLRNALLRLVGSARAKREGLSVDSNTPSFDPGMVNFPMSRLSRIHLDHARIGMIVARRRKNYSYLQEHCSGIPGVKMLSPDLPPGVCPWVFPLFFEGMPNAHLPLRARGIPAVTWGWVRHPAISKGNFPESDFLYENLVFLPVHQSLRQRDLDLIVEAIHTVRQTRNLE